MSREDRSTFGLTEPARQEQVQPEESKSHSFLSFSLSFFLIKDSSLSLFYIQNFPSERIRKKTPLLGQFQICFRLISCLLVPYLELVMPYYACLRPMKVFFFIKKENYLASPYKKLKSPLSTFHIKNIDFRSF